MSKLDLIIFFILGIFTALFSCIFILSFNSDIGNLLVSANLKNGDLYQMAKVLDFKFPIPTNLPQPELNLITDSDIIIMGDSFFNVSPGYSYFAQQIQNKTNLKIHNYNIQGAGELWRKTDPLQYLQSLNFKPDGKKRVLILESVDRGLMFRYGTKQKEKISKKTENVFDNKDKNPPKGAIELIQLNNNHLRLEGWAADEETESPLKKIVITIDGKIYGNAVTGFQRPDIANYFKKDSWLTSGWSYDKDLELSEGKHVVTAFLIDNNGNIASSNNKDILIDNNFLKEIKSVVAQIDLLIKNKLKSLDYLITENSFSFCLAEITNTIKFKLFRQISPLTPRYFLNPNVLFYKEEVSFYSEPLKKEDVKTIVDNFNYISKILKDNYNVDLIIIPMPSKYTIYHQLTGDNLVNNFFKDLFAELNSKNVDYIDLYTNFKQSKDFLYFPSDTHWNSRGINIAVNKTIEKIKKINLEE